MNMEMPLAQVNPAINSFQGKQEPARLSASVHKTQTIFTTCVVQTAPTCRPKKNTKWKMHDGSYYSVNYTITIGKGFVGEVCDLAGDGANMVKIRL